MNSIIDPHFGRCNWYYLYDNETHDYSFIENPVRHLQENAGYNAAELLIGKNIKMAIAGRFGSKAVNMFRKNNVQMVIPEVQQTLKEVISQIK